MTEIFWLRPRGSNDESDWIDVCKVEYDRHMKLSTSVFEGKVTRGEEEKVAEVEDTKPSWMPDRPYGYSSVMNALNVIISAKPDGYVYPKPPRLMSDGMEQPGCSYWHQARPGAVDEAADPGEPGCIVGQLLASYGVPRQVLIDCDDNAGRGSTSWSSINGRFEGLFTDEVNVMLQFIQTEQDDGTPWSELPKLAQAWERGWTAALHAARRKMRDLGA